MLDLVASEDVTHMDRRGGHIGLMAGSTARPSCGRSLAAGCVERAGH